MVKTASGVFSLMFLKMFSLFPSLILSIPLSFSLSFKPFPFILSFLQISLLLFPSLSLMPPPSLPRPSCSLLLSLFPSLPPTPSHVPCSFPLTLPPSFFFPLPRPVLISRLSTFFCELRLPGSGWREDTVRTRPCASMNTTSELAALTVSQYGSHLRELKHALRRLQLEL